MKLLTDDDSGEIRRSVFEDNVRDFQGADAPVNGRIRETLRGDNHGHFAVLNNGITIVVRDLRVTANTFRLADYQIVNGAQTSNVLFANRDVLDSGAEVLVPTRLIQTDDEDLITAIVTATNSQTQVRVEELNARASAERHVEKFFAGTEPPRNLLYERRSKQYENKGDVVKARVIDRYTLVRATAATFADEARTSPPDIRCSFLGDSPESRGPTTQATECFCSATPTNPLCTTPLRRHTIGWTSSSRHPDWRRGSSWLVGISSPLDDIWCCQDVHLGTGQAQVAEVFVVGVLQRGRPLLLVGQRGFREERLVADAIDLEGAVHRQDPARRPHA
jgi:AIPR protein